MLFFSVQIEHNGNANKYSYHDYSYHDNSNKYMRSRRSATPVAFVMMTKI